jgi:pyruvate,orthophosphate dikinase
MSSHDDITVFENPIDSSMILGSGIGIGSGVINGIIIFDQDDLTHYRKKYPGISLILVRPDTVPDDIGLIHDSDGLITARGGSTSHAAVTAARLGKICIVNAISLSVDEKNKVCSFNGEVFRPGDKVALDGNKGFVYKGNYPVTYLK